MQKENLFDKVSELKEKFKHFFQHRKKIAALENYSSSVKFHHLRYLSLIKACMNEGFLGEEESKFLEFMLNRYEINYLDWAHRTKWLKEQMGIKKTKARAIPMQMLIDFDKKQTPVVVPVALIAMQQTQMTQRAS